MEGDSVDGPTVALLLQEASAGLHIPQPPGLIKASSAHMTAHGVEPHPPQPLSMPLNADDTVGCSQQHKAACSHASVRMFTSKIDTATEGIRQRQAGAPSKILPLARVRMYITRLCGVNGIRLPATLQCGVIHCRLVGMQCMTPCVYRHHLLLPGAKQRICSHVFCAVNRSTAWLFVQTE